MQINDAFKLVEEFNMPSNIVEHVKKVAKVAEIIADEHLKEGFKLDKNEIICAAIVHDLFKLQAKHKHSEEAYKLLIDMNEPKIALMVYKHDMEAIIDDSMQPFTIEEKILNYSDKRVKHNKIVSLEERFEDIKVRYNPTTEVTPWEQEVYNAYFVLEKELFDPLDIEPFEIKEENLKDF